MNFRKPPKLFVGRYTVLQLSLNLIMLLQQPEKKKSPETTGRMKTLVVICNLDSKAQFFFIQAFPIVFDLIFSKKKLLTRGTVDDKTVLIFLRAYYWVFLVNPLASACGTNWMQCPWCSANAKSSTLSTSDPSPSPLVTSSAGETSPSNQVTTNMFHQQNMQQHRIETRILQ